MAALDGVHVENRGLVVRERAEVAGHRVLQPRGERFHRDARVDQERMGPRHLPRVERGHPAVDAVLFHHERLER